MRQADIEGGVTDGRTTAEQSELVTLRREKRRLEMENELTNRLPRSARTPSELRFLGATTGRAEPADGGVTGAGVVGATGSGVGTAGGGVAEGGGRGQLAISTSSAMPLAVPVATTPTSGALSKSPVTPKDSPPL